ncbi:MAG TPA: hypothetical protein VHM01_01035 [Alphaproteobacteria bacterium]|nr:hypothetical protein [Alphaproteobacteria bacterium]
MPRRIALIHATLVAIDPAAVQAKAMGAVLTSPRSAVERIRRILEG